MEIFKKLNHLIEQQNIIIFVGITVLFIVMLVTLLIKNKRVYCLETLLFVIPLLVIGFDCYERYIKGHKYFLKDYESLTLTIISTYIYFLAFIIAFIVFLICLCKKKEDNFSLNKDICATYSSKNKRLNFNKKFFDVISVLETDKKKWSKKCLGIYIGDEAIEYKKLGEYIESINGNFLLRLKFSIDKELVLTLIKENMPSGYGLILLESEVCKLIKEKVEKKEVTNKKTSISLIKYLESLNEPIGHFDNSINQYRLTSKMQDKLNLDSQLISSEEFRNFVYFEDYVTYDSLCNQKSGSYKYRYRLKTCDGIEWYEEVRAFENDEMLSTFHKVAYESNDVAIFNRDNLNKDLEQRIDKDEDFGLVFLYVEKAQSLMRKLGSEATKNIIENYFNSLKKNFLTNEDNIYKISNSEYCILFSDIKDYYNALNKVKKANSDLLKNEVYFEGNKYIITNTLGFVYTDELQEKNSLECIEAGLLSLYLAHNEGSKYHIYSVLNVKNEDEEFESYKVDLDNTFLDKI